MTKAPASNVRTNGKGTRSTPAAPATPATTPAPATTATTEGTVMTATTPAPATTATTPATPAPAGIDLRKDPATTPAPVVNAPAPAGAPVTLESMQAMLIKLAEENARLATAVATAPKAKKMTPRQRALTVTAENCQAGTLPAEGTTGTMAPVTTRGTGGTMHTQCTLSAPWLGSTVWDVSYDRRINQAQFWASGDVHHVVDGTWSEVHAWQSIGVDVAPAEVRPPSARNG